MTHDSHGPFPARVSFRPIDAPYVLGLLFGPPLLSARYWTVPLMGQIRPVEESARFWPVNPLRRFQPVLYSGTLTTRYACDIIKALLSYGLLTARYRAGPIPITPVYGPCRPIYSTARGPPILQP